MASNASSATTSSSTAGAIDSSAASLRSSQEVSTATGGIQAPCASISIPGVNIGVISSKSVDPSASTASSSNSAASFVAGGTRLPQAGAPAPPVTNQSLSNFLTNSSSSLFLSAGNQASKFPSSVAATEGSPPSSPRSSLSSFPSSFRDANSVIASSNTGNNKFAFPHSISLSGPPVAFPVLSVNPPLYPVTAATSSRSARNISTDYPLPQKFIEKEALLGTACSNVATQGSDTSLLEIPIFSSTDMASDSLADGQWELAVNSPEFKFSCSHFVAYKGFREKIHGHNYVVSLRIGGPVHKDGYIMDFSYMKAAVRAACKIHCLPYVLTFQRLNEFFLVPMKSDVMDITEEMESVCLRCEDGAEFKLPKSDCVYLPLAHSTAEELSWYIWNIIVSTVTVDYLKHRSIKWMEVSVSETSSQSAYFRRLIPPN
ncbi:6-pyruvoyl tetrahydrobiopterin synthase [Cardiosporidium cionae]|uniref:6-pyruvoyltetrahydropterin synthase n=1 Tax=Cardiosporidium cionae TaxID=476202 RepID=A0ABQ7J8Y5_9APIC|nr:6-pyruvoyl tetrahydrobiopterin synthase [Cardiosporidium cionae]|eukprot:KAF8820120.1 6-pyruvoyl tetrahydrobiopterin synthase [Cardiosporidium cionae]